MSSTEMTFQRMALGDLLCRVQIQNLAHIRFRYFQDNIKTTVFFGQKNIIFFEESKQDESFDSWLKCLKINHSFFMLSSQNNRLA